jgi:2-(1,2-epoxy-1,2-dihydrophenyl)acetyl-CoA isomerase
VGAGLGLALVADIILAAADARFRSAYTAIGFTPDLGASWHLPRLIGRARASDFLLTNQAIDAPTAASWGLASRALPTAELASAADALAVRLAAVAPDAQAGVRRLLRGDEHDAFLRQLDAEALSVTRASRSREGREGIQAFIEGRPALF